MSRYRVQLYLVRHALTRWNREQRFQGHTDIKVEREALQSLDALKEELPAYFSRIYSSDLLRCQQTLVYLLDDETLGTVGGADSVVVIDSRLREYHFGAWEGKTHQDLENDPVYKEWLLDWVNVHPPAGESFERFEERVREGLSACLQDSTPLAGQNILIVTHGGVIRQILTSFFPDKRFWEWKIPHGQGVRLALEQNKEGWICYSLSEVPMQEKERSCEKESSNP